MKNHLMGIKSKGFNYLIEHPRHHKSRILMSFYFHCTANFNYLKDEAICLPYLNGTCEEDNDCSLLHSKFRLPYEWQYKKTSEAWKTFPKELNKKIEKKFCEQNKKLV